LVDRQITNGDPLVVREVAFAFRTVLEGSQERNIYKAHRDRRSHGEAQTAKSLIDVFAMGRSTNVGTGGARVSLFFFSAAHRVSPRDFLGVPMPTTQCVSVNAISAPATSHLPLLGHLEDGRSGYDLRCARSRLS
jgi:hypothetical protein